MIFVGKDTPSNIVMSSAALNAVGNPVVLPPVMAFIIKAAQIYPSWKFDIKKLGNYTVDNVAHSFAIVIHAINERGNVAGRIELGSYHYHDSDVEFYNERISRAAERGNYKRTRKQDVALKLIKKWFTEPPVTERIEVAEDFIQQALSVQVHSTKSQLRQMEHNILGLMRDYVMDNIDRLWGLTNAFQSHIKANPSFTLEHFKELRDDFSIVKSVTEQKCLTVLIEDDKYIVRRAHSPIHAMTSDQLSESMRRAIGMLKLVEDGQFVRDMGFRARQNLYLIVDTLTEEEQCKTSHSN